MHIHLVAFARYLTADVLQLRRGVVEYLPLVVDNLGNGLGNSGVEFHPLGQVVEQRIAHGVVAQQETQALVDGVERAFKVEQGSLFDDSVAHTQPHQFVGEVEEVLRGKGVVEHQYLAEFLGLLQFAHHTVVVAGELHFAHHAHSQGVGAFGGEKFANLGKTQFVFYGHCSYC